MFAGFNQVVARFAGRGKAVLRAYQARRVRIGLPKEGVFFIFGAGKISRYLQFLRGYIPTLSIVIPTYNMSEWLAPALESCLWQSHKDIEVLVVDDGSADNSAEIATAYAALDPRIRVISQANSGLGATRQRGQDEASGDFITWLDADDFLDRHGAANWLGAASDGKVDLVCGNAVVFSNRNFNARRYFYHPPATNLHFDAAPRYWKSKVVWR